jgi:hypothetical protein
MSKPPFSMATLKRNCIWYNRRVLSILSDYVRDGKVRVCKVHTDLNVAEPLAKILPLAKFDPHQHVMGVRSLPDVN